MKRKARRMMGTPTPETVDLEVQRATPDLRAPGDDLFRHWVIAALRGRTGRYSIAVRLVEEEEGRLLNREYREEDNATNVLSFPVDLPADIRSRIEQDSGCRPLGDLVICAPVVQREAQEQHKPIDDHWAHLVVHGVLHLLGHDHERPEEAAEMENLEQRILAGLGVPDPYEAR